MPTPALPKAVVLLEVVIALALFFGAAVVVLVGLNSSVVAARKLRLAARAADLAVTLLSELQMGQRPIEDASKAYEEEALADWTWEIITSDVEDTWEFEDLQPMKRVEVIIAYPPRGFTYRLVRFFPPESNEAEEPPEGQEAPIEASFGGGL